MNGEDTRFMPTDIEIQEKIKIPKSSSKIMNALRAHFQSYSDLVSPGAAAVPARDIPQREDL